MTEPQRSREFILKPRAWPNLILPLKRRTEGGLQLAVFKPHASVMEISDTEPIKLMINETIFGFALAPLEIRTYKNVDELLADGWRVG